MMQWIFFVLYVIAPLSCVFAQTKTILTSAPVTTSLSELVGELREHNPEIQAARHRFDAATKRPSQVGTLPDPKLSVSNFGVGHPISRLNESNFAYNGIGITQEIPFP